MGVECSKNNDGEGSKFVVLKRIRVSSNSSSFIPIYQI